MKIRILILINLINNYNVESAKIIASEYYEEFYEYYGDLLEYGGDMVNNMEEVVAPDMRETDELLVGGISLFLGCFEEK